MAISGVMLLHFEGATASDPVDTYGVTTWSRLGTPELAAIPAVFGSTGARFFNNATNRYLSTDALDIPEDEDFTFEGWARTDSNFAYRNHYILDCRDPADLNSDRGFLLYFNSARKLVFHVDGAAAITGTITAPQNEDVPWCVSRVGGVIRIFVGVDGIGGDVTLDGSVADNRAFELSTTGICVGNHRTGAANQAFDVAGLDEIRGLVGFGRNATYTSDSAAFPDDVPTAALAITTQPVDQVVTQGEGATFTVAADGGAGPLSYQWFVNDEFMLGENATSLVVTTTLLDDGNVYHVVVTDGVDSVQSADATLTVNKASILVPVLQGPEDATVAEGRAVTFRVSAFGVGPFTYQWRVLNGAFVPGATSRVLTFVAYLQNSGARYEVIVTDVTGLVTTSYAALLTVTPVPVEAGSADVDYPCALPGVLVAHNNYRSKQRTRRNDLASGPPLFILEDDGGYEMFDVAWSFNAAQVQAFRNWFRHDLASGSRLFNINLMVEGFDGVKRTRPHECNFDGVPNYTQVGLRWRVTAQLVAIEEKILDKCANLTELFNGFCGGLSAAIDALNDIFPPTPPEIPPYVPPECQPYSCSAFQTSALELGDAYWPLDDPTYSNTRPEFYRKIDTAGDLGYTLRFDPGSLAGGNWAASVDSRTLAGEIDVCSVPGADFKIVQRDNASGSEPAPFGFYISPNPFITAGHPLVNFSCVTIGPQNGNFYYSSGGAELQFREDGILINPIECRMQMNVSRVADGPDWGYTLLLSLGRGPFPPFEEISLPDNLFDDGKAHFVATFASASYIVYTEAGSGNEKIDFVVDYEVQVDDMEFSGTVTTNVRDSSPGTGYSDIVWLLEDDSLGMRFMERAHTMAWLGFSWGTGEGGARAAMYNAYQRNFTDYTPPAYCVVSE